MYSLQGIDFSLFITSLIPSVINNSRKQIKSLSTINRALCASQQARPRHAGPMPQQDLSRFHSERAVSKLRLRERRRKSNRLGGKKEKEERAAGGKRESPKTLQHRLRRRSQSPQLTNYLGEGERIGSFK